MQQNPLKKEITITSHVAGWKTALSLDYGICCDIG